MLNTCGQCLRAREVTLYVLCEMHARHPSHHLTDMLTGTSQPTGLRISYQPRSLFPKLSELSLGYSGGLIFPYAVTNTRAVCNLPAQGRMPPRRGQSTNPLSPLHSPVLLVSNLPIFFLQFERSKGVRHGTLAPRTNEQTNAFLYSYSILPLFCYSLTQCCANLFLLQATLSRRALAAYSNSSTFVLSCALFLDPPFTSLCLFDGSVAISLSGPFRLNRSRPYPKRLESETIRTEGRRLDCPASKAAEALEVLRALGNARAAHSTA